MSFYTEIKLDAKKIFDGFVKAVEDPKGAYKKFCKMSNKEKAKAVAITAVAALIFGLIGVAFAACSPVAAIVLGLTFAVVAGTFALASRIGHQMKSSIL